MKFIHVFIFCLSVRLLLAQPIITSDVLPSVNEWYIINGDVPYVLTLGSPFNPYATGENITWDLSDESFVATSYDGTGDTIAGFPIEDMCGLDSFPLANMGVKVIYGEDYSYERAVRLTTSEYIEFGGADCEDFLPDYTVYEHPITLFKFPLMYGDTYSDEYVTGDVYVTFTGTVAAYGTLILPFMTVPDVLEVQCLLSRYTILDGDTVSHWSDDKVYFFNSFTLGEILQYRYQTNHVDYHVDWLELNQHIVSEAPVTLTGIKLDEPTLYPTLSNGDITIHIPETSSPYTVSILSSMGALVYTGVLLPGKNAVSILTASTGIYIVDLVSANTHSQKLIEIIK